MNLPNKLTMLRILLIPVFMLVLYWGFPGATWAALAVFVIASLTDLLDGKIARKYNLVTDFGKFADPLADKCLVTAAMLWFVEIGQMPAWALLIVIVREFAVSGLRMIASDKGRVIAAGWSGQGKDRQHHGGYRYHAADERAVDAGAERIEFPVRGGHCGDNTVFRRGILCAEPGYYCNSLIKIKAACSASRFALS